MNEQEHTPNTFLFNLSRLVRANPISTLAVGVAATAACFGPIGMSLGGALIGGVAVSKDTSSRRVLLSFLHFHDNENENKEKQSKFESIAKNAGVALAGAAFGFIITTSAAKELYGHADPSPNDWKKSIREDVAEQIGNGKDAVTVTKTATLCPMDSFSWFSNTCEEASFSIRAVIVNRMGPIAEATVTEPGVPAYKAYFLPASLQDNGKPREDSAGETMGGRVFFYKRKPSTPAATQN